jgi:radical SAM protein with 4Fe4S-binding SPASM domain
VYFCDLFIDQPDYCLGHLPEDDFDLILKGQALARHIVAARSLPPICQKCAYHSLCGGGCLYRRRLAPNNVDIYCSSRMRIVDHIASAVNAATTANGGGACGR